jgi:lactate dehydrogenase-like 2-hydroxyacid dehydrogenase
MDDTEQEQEQEQEQGQEVEELTSDSLDSSDLLLNAAPLEKEEISYENMTLKDLQTLAKSRHITGVSTMKKSALVDALKASQLDAFVVEELVA